MLRRIIDGPESKRRIPVDRSRKLNLLWSYLPDWILTLVLLGVIAGLTERAGFKREFSLTDTSIQHSYNENQRISFALDVGLSAGVTAAIIIFVGLGWRQSFWDVHNGLLGLFLSCSITTVATQVIKVTVGRPRPDMLARCQPIAGAVNAAVYGLSTWDICTVRTGHIIDDGFKSFPSGHSSFAFAGLGYLSLYLAGKMHLFDRRGHAIKAWIATAPLVGATLIAVSRTMDYRHHATDVIAGSLLGAFITFLVYFLYYPSLFSPNCHLPFSPRIPPSPANSLSPSSSNAANGGQPTYETPDVPLEDGTAPRPGVTRTVVGPPGGGGEVLGRSAPGSTKGSGYGRVGSREEERGENYV